MCIVLMLASHAVRSFVRSLAIAFSMINLAFTRPNIIIENFDEILLVYVEILTATNVIL